MFKKIFSVALIALVLIPFAASLCPSSAAFTGEDMITVVLDPGHGGKDTGAVGTYAEKYYNLKVAQYCAAKLRENGSFNVYMTRTTDDEFPSLLERGLFGDEVNADLFVSLHFNSNTDTSLNGAECYSSVLDRFDMSALSESVTDKLAAATGLAKRGCFRRYDNAGYYWSEEYQWDVPDDPSVGGLSDYYSVITWGAKFGFPAIIIEHAFLSNKKDLAVCDKEEMLKKMGEADADALIEYYTQHTHSYTSDYVRDYPVSCFSAGKQSIHCTICGHRKNVTAISAAPNPEAHLWITESETQATCQHPGCTEMYCRYTQNLIDKGAESYTEHTKTIETPQLEHEYELVEHRDASCTEDGSDRFVCKLCSDEYSDTFPATGHSYEKISHTDPTCTDDGGDVFRCSVCGDEYTEIIPTPGHNMVEESRTEPTCVDDGEVVKKCSVCGQNEKETLPALGHDMSEQPRIEPTCEEDGSITGVCSRCGETVSETIPALGHDFETVEVEEPTCTEPGKKTLHCLRCGENRTETLEALGHDYVLVHTEPYCEKDGSKEYKCSRCGDTYIEKIAAMGHKYVEAARVEATENDDGYIRYRCENCGEEYTEILEKLSRDDAKPGLDISPGAIAAVAAGIVIVATALSIIIAKAKTKPKKAGAHSARNEKNGDPESAESEKSTVGNKSK